MKNKKINKQTDEQKKKRKNITMMMIGQHAVSSANSSHPKQCK